MSVIKSGSNGNVASVNNDKRLLTQSVSESDLEYASETKEKAFSWVSSYSTGAANEEVISIKNTSTTDCLIIDEIIIGCAAACVFTLFRVTSGTAAGTPVTPRNWNTGSGVSASSTSFGNASVTGSLSGNTLAFDGVAANDFGVLDTKGGLVLGQNEEIAISASVNGSTVYVTVIGHYKTPE